MWAGMLLLMSTSVGIFAWTGDVLIGRASLGVLQQEQDKARHETHGRPDRKGRREAWAAGHMLLHASAMQRMINQDASARRPGGWNVCL
ncbi:MAG: hypothetical protein REJ50_23570, partial [Bordetella sp.]|nr:hypothetical protein [Bordetella sp.]